MPKNNELSVGLPVFESSRIQKNESNVDTDNQIKFNPNAISDVRVSQLTASYVRLLDKTNKLWNDVYDVLEKHYGSKQVDSIFEEDFTNVFCGLREKITENLIASINDRMSHKCNTKVI